MNHKASLLINTKSKKSYSLYNRTDEYYKKLRAAYEDIKSEKDVKEYSYFSFFILCSATIEYSLNHILADYCLKTYGPEYKKFTEGYTSLSLPNKIFMTPSILSNSRLVFNKETNSFRKLSELVTLRNKIMHCKESVGEFNFPDIDELKKESKEDVELSLPSIQINPINTLDKKKCLEFADALGDLKKHILDPWIKNELDVNKLLNISHSHRI